MSTDLKHTDVIFHTVCAEEGEDRGSVKSSQGGTAQPEGLWGELLIGVANPIKIKKKLFIFFITNADIVIIILVSHQYQRQKL